MTLNLIIFQDPVSESGHITGPASWTSVSSWGSQFSHSTWGHVTSSSCSYSAGLMAGEELASSLFGTGAAELCAHVRREGPVVLHTP